MEHSVKNVKCMATFMLSLLDESESSSDDDDDTLRNAMSVLIMMKRKKRKGERHRQQRYLQDVASFFTVDEFKTFFRLSRPTVQMLKETIVEICVAEEISGILTRMSTGGSIQKPLDDRILMLLWYMASLDKYAALADRFGVSESTACNSVRNLLQFIEQYMVNRYIVWPSETELTEIQDMYNDLKGFPGIVGMIDATHIKIKKPVERGIDYYNRKDYYSIVLQAVVREDMRFTNIFAGFPGKVHDARILRESPLYENGTTRCQNGHILGDSGYPNLTWLLTPFRDNGHLTCVQTRYNKIHSSIRSRVERAFGLLKGRFTRLQCVNQRDITTIVQTVLTACLLHNMCILSHDDAEDFLAEPDIVDQVQEQAHAADFDNNGQEDAALKRLEIARRLQ